MLIWQFYADLIEYLPFIFHNRCVAPVYLALFSLVEKLTKRKSENGLNRTTKTQVWVNVVLTINLIEFLYCTASPLTVCRSNILVKKDNRNEPLLSCSLRFCVRSRRNQGPVVRKLANVNPGLNVKWSTMFSCLKLFLPVIFWCSLRLLQLKTEGQTM